MRQKWNSQKIAKIAPALRDQNCQNQKAANPQSLSAFLESFPLFTLFLCIEGLVFGLILLLPYC